MKLRILANFALRFELSKYPKITHTFLLPRARFSFSHIFHAYFIRNEIVLHFWVKSFSQFRSQPVVFTGFTRCNNKTGGGKGQGEA